MNKSTLLSLIRSSAVALPLSVFSVAPFAQTSMDGGGMGSEGSSHGSMFGANDSGESGSSWLPYTNHGYVGINLGQPNFDDNSCVAGFKCDDPSFAGTIYTGGMFHRNFGVELGYVDMGTFKRNGGNTTAYGVNVSLLGNLPLSNSVNLFAKLGSTYGWTKTSAVVGPTGDQSGWRMSYGLGAGFAVAPRTELLVQWDRDRFKIAGDDKADVDLYTVGVKYHF